MAEEDEKRRKKRKSYQKCLFERSERMRFFLEKKNFNVLVTEERRWRRKREKSASSNLAENIRKLYRSGKKKYKKNLPVFFFPKINRYIFFFIECFSIVKPRSSQIFTIS